MINRSVKSAVDLQEIKTEYLEKNKTFKYRVLLCAGGGCISSNCYDIKDALLEAILDHGLEDKVLVSEAGCMGTCDIGPVMIVKPDGVFYTKLKPEDMNEIVVSHFINGNIKAEKTYYDRIEKKYIPYLKNINYFKQQVKIALRNCGDIDHSSIEEYIANNGYFGIEKALNELKNPEIIIEEIKKSGLRGRGGGGFPTGIKLEAGYKALGEEKFIVCNADEGDPGAFMDRSILEGDPHSIIEGMMISAYAIGANKGYIYVRAEYPLAVERLEEAIKQAKQAGLLGKNILSSSFNFDLDIRIGAGAFVCGEETALMESIEGRRGEPRQKPPFPFQRGLFDKPTIICNVETFANIPYIVHKGSKWFTQYGTDNSKGTKVFALAGDINNTGLVEVPMGKSLGEILYDIGGGIPKGKKFKAAQTGGPSGGCITSEKLNTPVDYDQLAKLGAIMGSGGLISMDEDTCMVDMAKFFMEFIQDESCGKCVPCRLGTKRMLEILERITEGNGQEGDIELLEELGHMIKETAICGLGQTAPNPVLSMIENFKQEYVDHIKNNYCEAGICSEMFISPCQNACPAGVNVPGYIALIIEGKIKEAYNLIRKENPFPAVCARVCTHPCESKCRRTQLDEAIAISDLKRYISDYMMKDENPYMDLVFPKKGKSIGIIGAGPSGLTCGYYLARLGYDVDVYEQQKVAGGVLAFGIPEYRLPKKVLNQEIKMIEQVGVKIHLNTEIGAEITFEDLKEKHDAVYIATGTQFSNKINIPGEELDGVYHGLDFLRDVNLGKEIDVSNMNVVIIGGGNTAIDAARVAIRKGAQEVTIIYRRRIEDMPADKREVRDALEEGIKIIELVAPVQIHGKDKKATEMECIKMELGPFDSSGRRKPVPVEDYKFTIHADLIIPAVSQYSDLPFINKDELELTKWGTFVTNPDTLMTRLDGVFAGGDVVRGSDVVITAITDGKNAAKNIDLYLGGQGILNTGEEIEIPKAHDQEELVEHERFRMRYLNPEERKINFKEVCTGYHKLNALAESMRCLRCDRRS